jgi:hypothetical protein
MTTLSFTNYGSLMTVRESIMKSLMQGISILDFQIWLAACLICHQKSYLTAPCKEARYLILQHIGVAVFA